MIKPGLHKHESFNQTMFCFEVNPPDNIKIWREDMDGNVDHWWDQEITPVKYHWLVSKWNDGTIRKEYPRWWENIDTRPDHINNLIQLDMESFCEVLNYYAFITPHKEWKGVT